MKNMSGNHSIKNKCLTLCKLKLKKKSHIKVSMGNVQGVKRPIAVWLDWQKPELTYLTNPTQGTGEFGFREHKTINDWRQNSGKGNDD